MSTKKCGPFLSAGIPSGGELGSGDGGSGDEGRDGGRGMGRERRLGGRWAPLLPKQFASVQH